MFAAYMAMKKDTKDDTSTITTLIVKMEEVKSIVTETKQKMENILSDVKALEIRVAKLEVLWEKFGNNKED